MADTGITAADIAVYAEIISFEACNEGAGIIAKSAAQRAAERIIAAAVPAIQAEAVAGEREKIAQLADEYDAVYPVDREDTYGGEYQVGVRFAELIREESGND